MASSTKATLLRLPRYDAPEPDQYVLVHVTAASATQPLNLQLHATEGERAFAVKLRQSKIYELRAKSYTGTAEDLGKIFSALLLKQNGGDLSRGVELAAAVDDQCVTLTVRQDIGGIKQRIAALQIPEEEVEIPIFEWAAEACEAMDNKSTQLDSLRTRVSYQERELEKLMAQAKDLVAFKKEHEETLLVKFSELLNSKKAKIRELSRELEMARAGDGPPGAGPAEEPEVVEPPEPGPARTRAARGRGRGRGQGPVGTRKRKPVAPPTDSESDGGFVKMDVDPKGKTPTNQGDDNGEDETEDEEGSGGYLRQEVPSDRSITEDEDEEELPPVRRPIAFTMRQPDKPLEKTSEKEDKGKGVAAAEEEEEEEEEEGEGEEEPVRAAGRAAGRGRGRGGRGRGKGSAVTATASPPARRGRGRGSRAKPREPTPSSPSPPLAGDETADSEDDEL